MNNETFIEAAHKTLTADIERMCLRELRDQLDSEAHFYGSTEGLYHPITSRDRMLVEAFANKRISHIKARIQTLSR